MRSQKGVSLVEVLVALAILSLVGVAYLSSLSTSSRALMIADEKQTARNIAELQMESIKSQEYSLSEYDEINIDSDYPGYSVDIDSSVLPRDPDTNIQRIEITISKSDKELFTLVGFKENAKQ